MKKILLFISIIVLYSSCQSQIKNIKEVNNEELSYVLANILIEKIINKELFNAETYVTLFEISDSKATPEELFSETDEVLSSYFISIVPDGDYYTTSKLFKIEGLINPKIISIKENTYPKFTIKIEYGVFDKRIIEEFHFKLN